MSEHDDALPALPEPEMACNFCGLADGIYQANHMREYAREAARAALAARAGEPITVEAVAEVVERDGEPRLSWLIEGGICDLPKGTTLLIAQQPITDAEGRGEVYVAAPPSPPAPSQSCAHRIADARNAAVESGYACVDCGAVFAAADHAAPPAPSHEAMRAARELLRLWEAPFGDADHPERIEHAFDALRAELGGGGR
jgi:hypothetical protein